MDLIKDLMRKKRPLEKIFYNPMLRNALMPSLMVENLNLLGTNLKCPS